MTHGRFLSIVVGLEMNRCSAPPSIAYLSKGEVNVESSGESFFFILAQKVHITCEMEEESHHDQRSCREG